VIILSSSKAEADISTAYRLGANAYLFKPTDTGKLQVIAKSIKDFWLTQNTPPPESHEKEAATGLTNGSRREAPGRVRQSTLETFSFLDNAQQSPGNKNL
jgi:DNA-binding NarL/FixJ family response regulator